MSDEERLARRESPLARAELGARAIPCLVCEKPVMIEQVTCEAHTLADIVASNFDRGVHCSTRGNYGSQVFDDDGDDDGGSTLNFVLCDGCVVRHSRKMIHVPDPRSQVRYEAGAIPAQNARDHFDRWLAAVQRADTAEDKTSRSDGVARLFRG